MSLIDEEICNLINKRRTEGLELLFNTYYKSMVLWADTFLNDMEASEDLVQDFFVKLWEQKELQKLKPESLKSYLFAIVRNRSLNALHKFDPLRNSEESFFINISDSCYDDLTDELLERLQIAVCNLPPRTKQILYCVYIDGMHYKEVADKLGVSVSTIKTLLVNALKRLRKECRDMDMVLLLFLKKIKFDSTFLLPQLY